MHKKPLIQAVITLGLIIFAGTAPVKGENGMSDYAGESILYLVSPIGRSEYKDLGPVDLDGVKFNVMLFKTKVIFLEDTEKIYSDPETLLPYRIERTVSRLWGKEFIIEEYDQKNFTVLIRKFKGTRLVNETLIKADGPIHNAVLLAAYVRRLPDLEIGWQFTARLPDEFKVELVSIDEITVPAGKFLAYHLKSIPDKFDIWISTNSPRVPLKIQGKGKPAYALVMKKHIFGQ